MIADLRNMEQSRWSGNLSGFRDYSPLYNVFRDQFSVSDEEEDDNLSGYYGYSPLHHRMREQFSVSEDDDDNILS
jgi:hypothetical protein